MATELFAEMQRRRVFRALIGYGVVAFAVLQIIEPVMHGLHWPDEVLTCVVVALGAGFPVVVGLAWIFDVNQGRIERTPGAMKPAIALALLGVSALAAAPGVAWYFLRRKPAAAEPAASIAVLPLLNLSSDKEQEYFSDGLTEELLNLLAQVPGLHVAARTSAFAFKGKNEDVRTIAQQLDVATLLEGSVRRSGDQIRITTQLINAADGYHLWSQTFDRKFTDLFAVQDEIAQAVVSALKVKLVAGQEPSSRSRRTDNAEVYSLYLQGRDQFNRSTLDGYRAAASTFQKALDLDPGFAPAWAGLAHATYWIADSGDSAQEIEQGQRKATAAAEKAVALGPDLPAGYIARGAIRSAVLRDWPGAQADFERALALSPQNADALRDYTIYVLRPLGKAEEGLAAARRAAELDPLNGRSWTTVASFLIALGRYAEARAALERSLQVNAVQSFAPGWLCVDLILEGQPAAALAAGQRSTSDVFRLTCIAMAQRALGNAAAANEALQTLTTKFGHSGAYQIAVVFAHAGDPDRAFEWLERARVQNDGGLALIKLDPQLRALRGDPRYAALLRKLDLPP